MKTSSKITAALLLAAMLLSCAACGNGAAGNDAQTDTVKADAANTTAAAETNALDSLKSADYGGKTFTILQRTNYEYEFEAPEETGDLINDAVYARNRTVEDKYNISIKTVTMQADWGGEDKFNSALTNTIMAGDAAYDLVAGYAAMILGVVQPGYFVDWYDIPNIDLSKPWWSEQIADSLTINNKMYAMTGDIALSVWKEMMTIYVNKKMTENYGITGIYDTVRDGSWTFDKLNQYAATASGDLDGDGKFTKSDLYGYASIYSTEVDTFMPAFDIQVVGRSSDGGLEYTINNEHTVGALDKLASFFFGGGNYTFLVDGSMQYEDMCVMFKEDRAMFLAGYLALAENLRDMDTDYGMIPYPKYDDTQEKYYSTCRDNFSLILFPGTATDLDYIGAVTEALCAYGYSEVVPVYYNTVLKDKYSRDADSAEMLDIIRDNLVYDVGYLNSFALDGAGHIFVGLVRSGKTDFASEYAKKEASINEKLAQMLEAYKD
ncbi:MAG: hypothetical protein WCQ72_08230 [Eubacteriales bacterium]